MNKKKRQKKFLKDLGLRDNLGNDGMILYVLAEIENLDEDPRYSQTIKLFYGIDCEPMTQKQIGQKYKSPVTQARVEQILAKGMRKLHYRLNNKSHLLPAFSLEKQLSKKNEEIILLKQKITFLSVIMKKVSELTSSANFGNHLILVNDLVLSRHTLLSLELRGIKTLADLLQFSEDDLLEIKNFGEKKLKEVKDALDNFRLKLK